jgi:hypothetical protein
MTVILFGWPVVGLSVADCRHDPCRLSGLENDDNLIRLDALEVGFDKFVAPALWRLDNRRAPSAGLLRYPGLKLFGGAAQHIAADRVELSVAAEKANQPLGLLKWLDQSVGKIRLKQRYPKRMLSLWCS